MEMHAVCISSCACNYNISKEIPAAQCRPNWFIISVSSVVFQGKWHKALYSPRCQPLTRLGGTFTSFAGLPGNEVEESVSPWPAGRHSPLVSQTKCNRQSQDMRGDCCSQTDVTSAGGQANNRTCLWKYQNITCHGLLWSPNKQGTCSVYSEHFCLHLLVSCLSLLWALWIKQASCTSHTHFHVIDFRVYLVEYTGHVSCDYDPFRGDLFCSICQRKFI